MAMIDLLQEHYVDHTSIESLLPGEVPKSGSVFSYKPVTEVTLKTGKVVQTSKPCKEIIQAIQAAEQVGNNAVATCERVPDDLVAELKELVKEISKMTSHVHFISECIQRQTMGGLGG